MDHQNKLRSVGLDSDPDQLPITIWSTDNPDIYMYLISRPGKYTLHTFDTWSYFKAGFVGEIKVMRTSMDILVVCGQVRWMDGWMDG